MKKYRIVSLVLAGLAVMAITISSCKKDKNEDEVTQESTTGTLMFHLHTMADTNEVEAYGDTLTMTGGKQVVVDVAQLYLSNIKLIKTDGSVVDGPSTIVLIKQGVEEYELGAVPAGNYKAVRFDVGLSDAINGAVPASSNSTLYQTSMWFDASMAMANNFVFANFQGKIDTTVANSGANLVPFAIKLGTNAHRVAVTMPDNNFTVTPNQMTAVHMSADYAKLLDGVQLKVNSNLSLITVAHNSSSLANQIAANAATMFDYE